MHASSSRMEMLARYSALDARLRDDAERALHTGDVETFLEVLFVESTEAGRLEYERQIDQTDAQAYPWSAVRAREVSTGGLELDVALAFAPPALVLALTRRVDLEPELPGDELPEQPLQTLIAAIETWDPAALLDSIAPFGWAPRDDEPRGSLDDVDAMAAVVVKAAGDMGV